MIKTAKQNAKKYADKKVKFTKMNNLEMTFPKETFDLISARHTIINAKQIYNCLVIGGTVVIRGVDKKDCWEIKELFGRGQAYNDEMAISENERFEHRTIVEKDLFDEYVKKYKTDKGILLKRVLYGIVAKKCN